MTCTADVNDPSAANSNIRGSVQLLAKHEKKHKQDRELNWIAEREHFRKL